MRGCYHQLTLGEDVRDFFGVTIQSGERHNRFDGKLFQRVSAGVARSLKASLGLCAISPSRFSHQSWQAGCCLAKDAQENGVVAVAFLLYDDVMIACRDGDFARVPIKLGRTFVTKLMSS
jgi:hypothetical protein